VYIDRDGKEVYVTEFPGFRRHVLIGLLALAETPIGQSTLPATVVDALHP
jgi:hypothetical protein